MTERRVNVPGWLLVLVLFAVAGLLLGRDYRIARQIEVATPAGKLAPDAAVEGVNGRALRLSSFRGRPVWLNFFATWCQPCKAEMPQIEQRYLRYKSLGLGVVAIDQQETPAEIQRFATSLGLTFPIVIDGGPAAEAYRVFALPTSVFVDAHGVIQARHTGEMSPQEMDKDLAKIIAER